MGEERGNKNLPLDEGFIDQAWSDMESLLDQHLPVKKKKRFAGWWLLTGFFIFGVLGGLMFYSLQDSEKERAAAERLNNVQNKNIEQLQDPGNSIVLTENDEKVDNDNPTAEKPAPPAVNNENVRVEKNTGFTPGPGIRGVMPESTLETIPFSGEDDPSTKMNNPAPTKAAESDNKTIEKTRKETQPINPFASIFEENISPKTVSLISASGLNPGLLKEFNLDVTDPVSFSKHNFFGGLELKGGFMAGTKGLSGLTFNTAVDLAVHPKWSIKPELGYAYLTTSNPFAFTSGRSNQDVLFASEFDPGVLVFNDTSESFTFSGVNAGQDNNGEIELKGVHSFSASFTAEYQISRKFSIFAGPSMAYAFNIKATSDKIVVTQVDANASSPLTSFAIPVTNGIRRFDPGFVTGLGFEPNKNLRLEVRYNHHFSNIKRNGYFVGNDKINHSGVQLTLGYKLR